VAATRDLDRGRGTAEEEVSGRAQHDGQDFIRVQREAGLDFYSDGLLGWQDLFRPFTESCLGIEAGALVRWFDNNAFFRVPKTAAG